MLLLLVLLLLVLLLSEGTQVATNVVVGVAGGSLRCRNPTLREV